MLGSERPDSTPVIKSTLYLLMQCGCLIANAYAARYMISSQKSKTENNATAIESIVIFLLLSIFTSGLLIFPIRENARIRKEEKKKEPELPTYNATLNLLSEKLTIDADLLKERVIKLCQSHLNVPAILTLIDNNQNEKPLRLNLAELYVSPKNTQKYMSELTDLNLDSVKKKIALKKFDQLIYQILSKDSLHGLVFSLSWFSIGNFGWQSIDLLALCSNDWSAQDSGLNSTDMNKTLVTWICAGLGTSAFLVLSMMISQRILSSTYFGGRAFGESYLMALQFIISVTISDGLWQFFTDLPKVILNWLGVTGETSIIFCIALQILCYLAESFLFKNLHNSLNYFHDFLNQSWLFEETQMQWTCTNSFTALLWLNYCSFNFGAQLVRYTMNVPDSSCHPLDLFLISLAGGIGGVVLPAMLDYTQHIQRMHEIKTCFSKTTENDQTDLEAAVTNPLTEPTPKTQPLLSPVSSTNNSSTTIKKKTLTERGCIFFNKTISGFVQIVADSYPSPRLFKNY